MSAYVDLAHERAVFLAFQRILLDRYLASESEPKDTLHADDTFGQDREVTQRMLQRIFDEFQLRDADLRARMGRYRWVSGENNEDYKPPATPSPTSKPKAPDAKPQAKSQTKRAKK